MAATDNAAEQVAHIAEKIRAGKTTLGIEFGSTRIKAVLIDDNFQTIASGDYSWASHLEDGLWSYTTEEIWGGLQSAYASMANDVETAYGEKLTHVGHIGFSAMMHGYLAFDEAGELWVPFRTWQNTHLRSSQEALRAVPVQHPRALVHRSPVPGRAQQGRARLQGGLLHHTRRLRALEAHR